MLSISAVLFIFVSLCLVLEERGCVLLPSINHQQLNVVFIQLGRLINIYH